VLTAGASAPVASAAPGPTRAVADAAGASLNLGESIGAALCPHLPRSIQPASGAAKLSRWAALIPYEPLPNRMKHTSIISHTSAQKDALSAPERAQGGLSPYRPLPDSHGTSSRSISRWDRSAGKPSLHHAGASAQSDLQVSLSPYEQRRHTVRLQPRRSPYEQLTPHSATSASPQPI
jgi:hypothetical protein